MSPGTLEIDGSFGEGGGQVLRSSLALALITGRAVHIRNVRARRRPRPGLQPQHLASVRAAAAIGRAELRGATLGSSDLTFAPGPVAPGPYHFAIGTAGATGLVLHTVYLPLALQATPSEVTLEGGTHVRTSPIFHFLDATWRAWLERVGLRVGLRLRRPGFYPRGGGRVEATIQPWTDRRGLCLVERGPVAALRCVSAVAGLPPAIAERQARRAAFRLQGCGVPVDVQTESWDGGPGTMLALAVAARPVPALFFGLGERGKPAERVADEAADQALAYLAAAPAAVDSHSADQLVLPLAFATGPSEFSVAAVTRHLLTNIAVIRTFIDRDIVCTGVEGAPGVVRIA